MNLGVLCPKCGLMQMNRPACKACGTPLSDSAFPFPPSAGLAGPKGIIAGPESPATSLPPSNGGGENAAAFRLAFRGKAGELFGLYVLNMFLSLITLGVYYFWGKAKIQSYLYSRTEFEKERFVYHGTGKELLLGFLKALAVFFIPLYALSAAPALLGAGVAVQALATGLTYGIVMVFVPLAMVGARRYRLSRTSWRGIRFSFRGEGWDFIKVFGLGSILSTITLGLYFPFFDAKRYDFMVSRSYFGSGRFGFDGRGKDLFRPFLLAILLTVPTLGLYWFWYWARRQRYYWEHTTFGTARFRFTGTGRVLMNLQIANFLIALLTLGLGWPWVLARKIRFVCRYLTLEGTLDPAGIHQDARQANATGEALSGFLDADFSLG
jgi:uncharacterized membrane protein YjgN (DUF898 family)